MKFDDLRIYDRDFNLLLILPRYLSVNWELKFCGYGNGEIQLEKTDEILELLTKNKYLFVVQGDIQAIVTGYKIAEICTVFTRTLEWLLTKFAVRKFCVSDLEISSGGKCSSDDFFEYILKEYLHEDFHVEFKSAGTDEGNMFEFSLDNPSDVYSVITEQITRDKTGFRFYRDFDEGHFIFEMKDAEVRENLIFCDLYKTSYDSEYNFDIQNETNGAIYYHKVTKIGDWDPVLNEPEIIFDASNYGKYYTITENGRFMGTDVRKGQVLLCRRDSGVFEILDSAEPFLVEIPPEENGIFSWVAPLLSTDSVSARKEFSKKKAFDVVNCMTGLSYKEDFFLGDVVKTRYFAGDFSAETEKLISAVHIWDEAEDCGAYPTFTEISQEVDYVI